MPVKLTWKSILGAVAAVLGVVLPTTTGTVTHTQGAAVTAGGLLLVGLARLADSKDFATVGAGAEAEIAKVKAEGEKLLAEAKATIDQLAPKAAQLDAILASAAAPAPVAPPVAAAPAPVAPLT